MVQTAAAAGISPRELADRNSARFRDLAAALNISNDDFIRTTEPRHYEASQEIWRRMAASNNGDIYQSTYKGWYSVRDEAYFDEDELTDGEDGKKLAPTGRRGEVGRGAELLLPPLGLPGPAAEALRGQPGFHRARGAPQRDHLVRERRACGTCRSRRTTFDWGIPVPGAPGHVMYVWVDALTNYITGVGFPDDKSRAVQEILAGRTCTSSARTSSASTPSTGRPS